LGSYSKIEHSTAFEILKLYGFEGISELTPLSLGISNSNYRVVSQGQNFLLKISNDKGYHELQKEMIILQHLKLHDFPYSLSPFETLAGEAVYRYGDYFGVLFPFLEGIPPGPSDITCREIGAGLAQLHLIPASSQLRTHEEVGYGAKEILQFIQSERCPSAFKESFFKVFPDRLESFLASTFPVSIIHGDLYYDNTLFKHESLGALLDFEQAGLGESILDLGISISGTCLEKGWLSAPLVRSYLQGYESVRPLIPTEKNHLHESICLGLFSIALWRIRRFMFGDLNPLMAESYLELLHRAEFFHQHIKPQDWNEYHDQPS
jgi:homoserine kinase type II